jgi:hypothetical protein
MIRIQRGGRNIDTINCIKRRTQRGGLTPSLGAKEESSRTIFDLLVRIFGASFPANLLRSEGKGGELWISTYWLELVLRSLNGWRYSNLAMQRFEVVKRVVKTRAFNQIHSLGRIVKQYPVRECIDN